MSYWTLGRWYFWIHPYFKWFDLWIGAYWDRGNKWLYLQPLPCIGLCLRFRTWRQA